jgi:hypothetical protein
MARLAGLTLRQRYSGWNREPFASDSATLAAGEGIIAYGPVGMAAAAVTAVTKMCRRIARSFLPRLEPDGVSAGTRRAWHARRPRPRRSTKPQRPRAGSAA